MTRELGDLLAQGPFRLYELVRALRGAAFPISGRLCAVSWPDLAIVDGPLPIAILNDADTWSKGASGRLVVLVPAS